MAWILLWPLLAADPPWKYAADPGQRNDLFWASVPLTDEAPSDVKVELKWTGVRRHFGQLRYGAGDSVRIAVAVDERADGSADVYMDSDRTRSLTPAMKLKESGPTWVTSLTVSTGASEAERTVLVHWGPKAKVLGIATLGGVEGTTKVGDRDVRCQVVDADGNGLFSDAGKDVLRIDLDGDGKFDLFREQFRLRPLMTFGKDRWIVHGRPLDGSIAFSPLKTLGKIALKKPSSLPKTMEGIVVELSSTDGVSVVLSKLGEAIEAPPGSYAIQSVSFSVPAADGLRWKYAFYRDSGATPVRFDVTGDKTTAIDPLGELKFSLAVRGTVEEVKAGQEIQLWPAWKSATGLQINTVYFGDENTERNQPRAVVELKREGGKVVGRDYCGFF